MGGGRVPGPIRGDDPFERGFADPVPLGGGAATAGLVTLAGWPRRLTWDDFTEVATRPSGASEAAQIHTEVIQPDEVAVARDGGRFRISAYTVTVQLVSADTWVVSDQKSAALLAHEQGHYDITGLTARDMVARIAAVRASSTEDLQTQVQAIIAAAGTLATQLTSAYDGSGPGGTSNGQHAANQARWEAHLASARTNGTRLTGGPS